MQRDHTNMTFSGPLYVIGMPRSGTKLMRALLNQHPQINITEAESKFIPSFVAKFGDPPRFEKANFANLLMKELSRTSFYRIMTSNGYKFDRDEFIQSVDHSSWSSIFQYILVSFGPKPITKDMIWGDKTPAYISYMPLLKHIFPQARFIHMIRDPRDFCLSFKKASGRNIYRAAQRWNDHVAQARAYGDTIQNDYMEVYYEELIDSPETIMKEVCHFLDCAYSDDILQLESSHEKGGDTKGQRGIISGNTKKFLTEFSEKQIRRIEEIVCQTAQSNNYILENHVTPRPVGAFSLAIYRIYDGVIRRIRPNRY